MDFSEAFARPADVTYFDSAASSLTAKTVLSAMDAYYTRDRANIHRGAHRLTRRASESYEAVYDKLAKFFHASTQEFTAVRNTTEALNAVAIGLDWKEGDEIIVTDIEHHSNLLPWLSLKEKGVKIKVLTAETNGLISTEKLLTLLNKNTKLLAFTACSNVLGAEVSNEKMTKIAKDNGTLVALDAAQLVGHHLVDLKKLPVDFMAFSGHKTFGPTGIGVLFHRKGTNLKPWFLGGGTVRDVNMNGYTLLENRERFEAGTPAIAEWIGMGAALDTISNFGYDAIQKHDQELIHALLAEFEKIENLTLYGPLKAEQKSCALFSFSISGTSHHQVALMLDELGFAVRSGHHCAIPLTKKLGVDGTVRASLHAYNSVEEVRHFGDALRKVASLGG